MLGFWACFDNSLFRNSDPMNYQIQGAEQSNSADWLMEISIQSDGITLRDFLNRFSKTFHFSYFLDRRLDPGMILICSIDRKPFIIAIQELTEQNNLSFCVYDSLLYIGPKNAAGELLLALGLFRQTLEERSETKSQQLLRKISFKTDDFSVPKELLEQLLRRTDWRWEALDKMPFDCWNRLNLPNLSVCDIIGLILIGFDVRLEMDQKSPLTLRPMSLNSEICRYYLSTELSMNDENRFPDCRFDSEYDSSSNLLRIRVDGFFRDIAAIEYFVAEKRMNAALDHSLSQRANLSSGPNKVSEKGRNSKTKAPKIIQTTADIKNKSLADIFKALEKELDLSFQLDPSLSKKGISLETRISCHFEKAGQEKIIQIIAQKIEAQYRIEDQKVIFYLR